MLTAELTGLISDVDRRIVDLWGKTFAISDTAAQTNLIQLKTPLLNMHAWLRTWHANQFTPTPNAVTAGQSPLVSLQEFKQAFGETRTAILNAMRAAGNCANPQIHPSLSYMHDELLSLEARCLETTIRTATEKETRERTEREAQERDTRERAERERTEREAREREARERTEREAAKNKVNWNDSLLAGVETSVSTLAVQYILREDLLLRGVMSAIGLTGSTPLAAGLIVTAGTIGLGLTLGCLKGKCSENANPTKSLDSGLAAAATSVFMLLVGSAPAVIIGGGTVCAYYMSKYKLEDRAAQRAA